MKRRDPILPCWLVCERSLTVPIDNADICTIGEAHKFTSSAIWTLPGGTACSLISPTQSSNDLGCNFVVASMTTHRDTAVWKMSTHRYFYQWLQLNFCRLSFHCDIKQILEAIDKVLHFTIRFLAKVLQLLKVVQQQRARNQLYDQDAR